MKFILRVCLAAMAIFASTSIFASVITYQVTAAGGHNATFVYDDTATSIGPDPFNEGGVAYAAISLTIDGVSIASPELAIYTNFDGNQFAYFVDSAGHNTFVVLAHAGLDLFSSSAASQMDGRSIADFNLVDSAPGSGSAITEGARHLLSSLTEVPPAVTGVPEPESLALLGLGIVALSFARRRRAR